LNIEGLGRQLYPRLDLWTTAKPYLEQWMHNRMGPKAIWKEIKRQAPAWVAHAPQMPELIRTTLNNVAQYPAQQKGLEQKLDRLTDELAQHSVSKKHRAFAVTISALGLIGLHTPYLWGHGISTGLISIGLVWLLLKG